MLSPCAPHWTRQRIWESANQKYKWKWHTTVCDTELATMFVQARRARAPTPTLLAGLADGGGKPVEALVQAVAGRRAGRLDVPVALAERVEAELVSDLGGVHRVGQVLLVGEDEQHRLAELVLVEHAVQLVAGLSDTVAIVGIDDEDDTLRVLVVVAPERADLVLAAHVPHRERDVLVLDGLDVEADGGDGGHDLTELELVEDGGLTGGVEANHEDAYILLAEEALEHLAERETHGELCEPKA